MSETTTEQGNKLIAEFMGFELMVAEMNEDHPIGHGIVRSSNYSKLTYYHYKDDDRKNFTHPEYHTSWDWLMPVVEKIYVVVDPKTWYGGDFDIFDLGINAKIEIVWNAVIQFIQWYQKQTP